MIRYKHFLLLLPVALIAGHGFALAQPATPSPAAAGKPVAVKPAQPAPPPETPPLIKKIKKVKQAEKKEPTTP